MKPTPIKMPDYYTRVRRSFTAYGISPFDDSDIRWRFITFRHQTDIERATTLELTRKEYPLLYALLIELEIFDDIYRNKTPDDKLGDK